MRKIFVATVFALLAAACANHSGNSAVQSADAAASGGYRIEAVINASGDAADMTLKLGDRVLGAYTGCAKTDGAPDMITAWEACGDADYSLELDNPSDPAGDYQAYLSFPAQPGAATHQFACDAEAQADGTTRVTCDDAGAMSLHANPHTSVGVSN